MHSLDLRQHGFDLRGKYVGTAADDQIHAPVGEKQIAVCIEVAQIAHTRESTVDGIQRRFPEIRVLRRAPVETRVDFATSPGGSGRRSPSRMRISVWKPRPTLPGRRNHSAPSMVATPVSSVADQSPADSAGADALDPGALHPVRTRCGHVPQGPNAAEVGAVERGGTRHSQHHGRHDVQNRRPVALDHRQRPLRIEPFVDHDTGTCKQGDSARTEKPDCDRAARGIHPVAVRDTEHVGKGVGRRGKAECARRNDQLRLAGRAPRSDRLERLRNRVRRREVGKRSSRFISARVMAPSSGASLTIALGAASASIASRSG